MNRTRVVLTSDGDAVGEAVLVDHEQAVVYTPELLPDGPLEADYLGNSYSGQLTPGLFADSLMIFLLDGGAPGPYEYVPPDPGKDPNKEKAALTALIATWWKRSKESGACPDDPNDIEGVVGWICRMFRHNCP